MSAGEPGPVEPPVVRAEPYAPVEGRRSAAWGVTAFVLAVLVFLIEPAVYGLVNTAEFIDQASTISGNVMSVQIFATIGVLSLAIVAALQRNGIGWAIAAICISLAANSYIRSVLGQLFGAVFQAIFVVPEFGY